MFDVFLLMKTPPFLLFAALLFWGWQSHWLVVGALAGAVLEASRQVKSRWDLEDVDFNRIWSLCFLVTAALVGYYITTSDQGGGIGRFIHRAPARNGSDTTPLTAFRWLPLTCFPFIAAQVYNLRPSVPLTAVSLVLRLRRRRGEASLAGHYLDISYGYFIICVFAAGIHQNNATHSYLWGQALLILWALWKLRTRRFGTFYWAAAMVTVMALGLLGEAGIGQVERIVQNFDARMLARFFRPNLDPTQSITAMGQIGELKLSSRIVVWLQPEQAGFAPNYLREASYATYQHQTWKGAIQFYPVPVDPTDGTSWIFLTNKPGTATINITCYLNGRSKEGDPEGVLPLPSGTCRLLNLPALLASTAIGIQTNRLGAVLANGAGLMVFDARYGPGATFDSGPDSETTNRFDLGVPTNEIPAIQQAIDEINFANATNDALKRLAVAQYFATKFTYSMWQGPPPRNDTNTPLARFLLETRSGHCEYFATATVLLLRRLGVPARYAIGYAVHETSGSGYLVRERDAHAWCLTWDNDRKQWVDFDTTPASWVAVEDHNTWLEDSLSYLRAWLVLQFEKLRWRQAHLREYILWTLAPVMAVLVYFIIFQRRTKARTAKKSAVAEAPAIWPGHDSAFYRLEKALTEDLPREPDESLSGWLERALAAPALAEFRVPLRELLRLHYRYRFDPDGLTAAEKQTLVEQVQTVLGRLKEMAR